MYKLNWISGLVRKTTESSDLARCCLDSCGFSPLTPIWMVIGL